MKTREEYLVEFEKKLLATLKDLYTSVNKNFVTIYGLSILAVLFNFGSISEMNFLGAKITINGKNILVYISVIVSIFYFLINFQFIRIASIYSEINKNSSEIIYINNESRPIRIDDIYLFGYGITELILSLGERGLHALLKYYSPLRTPIFLPFRGHSLWYTIGYIFRFTYRLYSKVNSIIRWLMMLITYFGIIIALFFIPGIVVGYLEYKEFYYGKDFDLTFDIQSLSSIILILTGLITIVCGLKLILIYLINLIEDFNEDIRSRYAIERETIHKAIATIQKITPRNTNQS